MGGLFISSSRQPPPAHPDQEGSVFSACNILSSLIRSLLRMTFLFAAVIRKLKQTAMSSLYVILRIPRAQRPRNTLLRSKLKLIKSQLEGRSFQFLRRKTLEDYGAEARGRPPEASLPPRL